MMPAQVPTHAAPSSPRADKGWLSLSSLVLLRWGAVAGQSVTAGVAAGLGLELPLRALFALIGLGAASNLVAALLVRRETSFGRGASGAFLAFDTFVLTGLLYLTGGAHNPFSVLYLVHIALAAVILGSAWTWALAALAVACYGLLFRFSVPLALVSGHDVPGAYDVHLRGMWLAFALAAGLIAYFGARVAQALERREAEVIGLREQAARQERLASLATLAAGAAHELGTPLGTIGVAAREVERAALSLAGAEEIASDARLIRAELLRCRGILEGLAAEAGEPAGEPPVAVPLAELAGDVVAGLPAEAVARLRVTSPPPPASARVPRQALVRALGGLVRNALDASPDGTPVRLDASLAGGRLRVSVDDRGRGMPPDVLARAGEPFFSTKAPGEGLGLGLFLARTLAERLGGELRLESQVGRGTRAVFEVPVVAEVAA